MAQSTWRDDEVRRGDAGPGGRRHPRPRSEPQHDTTLSAEQPGGREATAQLSAQLRSMRRQRIQAQR